MKWIAFVLNKTQGNMQKVVKQQYRGKGVRKSSGEELH
jgi:hypothetical protein